MSSVSRFYPLPQITQNLPNTAVTLPIAIKMDTAWLPDRQGTYVNVCQDIVVMGYANVPRLVRRLQNNRDYDYFDEKASFKLRFPFRSVQPFGSFFMPSER